MAFAHEVAAGWAIRTLGNWAVPRGGHVGASDGRFRPTARRGRRPDAFVYLAGSPRPGPRDKLLDARAKLSTTFDIRSPG